MSQWNQLTMIGYLAKDAEHRKTPDGKDVFVFVASLENRSKTKTTTTWVTCEWYIDPARNKMVNYLKKGTQVFLAGPIVQENWTNKDGKDRSRIKLFVRDCRLVGAKKAEATAEKGQGVADDDSGIEVADEPTPL